MRADTAEWVRCAEEDFTVATVMMKSRQRISTNNSTCFHCQQCVEKYLKGRMAEAGLPIPKVHNLMLLLNLTLPLEPLWASFMGSLTMLNNYAVHFRYPGHVAARQDARYALKACRSLRKEARGALGLPAK